MYVEICSKKEVLDHFYHEFSGENLSDEMMQYIREYTKESPYYYITILDNSSSQGALPTCNKNKISYYRDF